jgi:hypothetical protein
VAFVVIDLVANERITWSPIAVLAVAFIVGGVMILQFLARPDRRDRRPFVAGVALVILAVILLPIAIALQSSPTFTEAFTVQNQPGVNTVALDVFDEAGQVSVQFAPNPGYLVQAEVTQLGGFFSSYYPGDVIASNTTSGGTMTFTLTAKGVSGLFFLGGHDIVITVSESAAVTMQLSSTTGTIDVVVPTGVHVASGGITATVTTGNVEVTTTDVVFAAGSSVQASSTTGQVTLSLTQRVVYAGTVDVRGTSTTGSISFTFNRGDGVAARVACSVTTGSVIPSGSKYTGTNGLLFAPNETTYDSAFMQFQVTLQTTTGNINLR